MPLGQIGYEAYAASTGGKTFDGRPMPTWAQIAERSPHVAKAWNDAACAIEAATKTTPESVGGGAVSQTD